MQEIESSRPYWIVDERLRTSEPPYALFSSHKKEVDQEAVDQAMIQACISVVLHVKSAEPKQKNVGNNSFTRGKL